MLYESNRLTTDYVALADHTFADKMKQLFDFYDVQDIADQAQFRPLKRITPIAQAHILDTSAQTCFLKPIIA